MLRVLDFIFSAVALFVLTPLLLPIGRFLRKIKINELPQILNILLGDMSIVEPRPLMSKQFGFYDDAAQKKVASVHLRLTGVGSLVFRDEERFFDGASNPDNIYRETISLAKRLRHNFEIKDNQHN